jgi:hypothetical protein
MSLPQVPGVGGGLRCAGLHACGWEMSYTMRIPRTLRVAATAVAAVVLLAVPIAGAGASPPIASATGGIALSGPAQYVAFSAFDYGPTGDRGSVNYTNFTYADPGSGVWAVNGQSSVVFEYSGAYYPHTMSVESIYPTSNTSYTFTGSGYFDPNQAYTWTVTGSVVGTTVTLHIVYTGAEAGYYLDATGTIQPDGSVLGTSFSDSLGRTLTWAMPAGSAAEILSYTASITQVEVVGGDTSTFSYTIPAGTGLDGVAVTMDVTDGGTPGTSGDVYGHNGSTYQIIGGNLVVH